jgi:hypothetical protein
MKLDLSLCGLSPKSGLDPFSVFCFSVFTLTGALFASNLYPPTSNFTYPAALLDRSTNLNMLWESLN